MADSMDDAVRELVECFYAAVDRRDWSTFEALVSPRVVVEVGSSEPFGWDEWRADLEEFYSRLSGRPPRPRRSPRRRVPWHLAMPIRRNSHRRLPGRVADRHKVSIAVIHIDRFQGDTFVAHRGQLDMHGLLAQLEGD